jgi:phytol kinase
MLMYVLFALSAYAVVILSSEISFKAGYSSFVTRKIAHMFCGLITASLPLFLTLPYAVLTGLLLSLFVFLSKKLRIFKGIEHSDELSWGTLYFPLGFVLSALIFWNMNTLIFSGSALVLGFADSCAALIGKRFGKRKIPNTSKSYVGTATFVCVTLFISVLMYYFMQGSFSEFSLLRGFMLLIGSILIAGVEAISDNGTDNLYIPLSAGMLLYLIA